MSPILHGISGPEIAEVCRYLRELVIKVEKIEEVVEGYRITFTAGTDRSLKLILCHYFLPEDGTDPVAAIERKLLHVRDIGSAKKFEIPSIKLIKAILEALRATGTADVGKLIETIGTI